MSKIPTSKGIYIYIYIYKQGGGGGEGGRSQVHILLLLATLMIATLFQTIRTWLASGLCPKLFHEYSTGIPRVESGQARILFF